MANAWFQVKNHIIFHVYLDRRKQKHVILCHGACDMCEKKLVYSVREKNKVEETKRRGGGVAAVREFFAYLRKE